MTVRIVACCFAFSLEKMKTTKNLKIIISSTGARKHLALLCFLLECSLSVVDLRMNKFSNVGIRSNLLLLFSSSNPRLWTVSFGTYLTPSLLVRPVKTIIVHEKYRYPAHEYDIAVLQLAKRVDFTNAVHRVCLPDATERIPYNIDAVITGWGAMSDDGKHIYLEEDSISYDKIKSRGGNVSFVSVKI